MCVCASVCVCETVNKVCRWRVIHLESAGCNLKQLEQISLCLTHSFSLSHTLSLSLLHRLAGSWLVEITKTSCLSQQHPDRVGRVVCGVSHAPSPKVTAGTSLCPLSFSLSPPLLPLPPLWLVFSYILPLLSLLSVSSSSQWQSHSEHMPTENGDQDQSLSTTQQSAWPEWKLKFDQLLLWSIITCHLLTEAPMIRPTHLCSPRSAASCFFN